MSKGILFVSRLQSLLCLLHPSSRYLENSPEPQVKDYERLPR